VCAFALGLQRFVASQFQAVKGVRTADSFQAVARLIETAADRLPVRAGAVCGRTDSRNFRKQNQALGQEGAWKSGGIA
jgi:hypothetical protein